MQQTYNRDRELFFSKWRKPKRGDVLDYAKKLAQKYGFEVLF